MAKNGPLPQVLQQNPQLMAALTDAQVSQILPADLSNLTAQHMHHLQARQIVFLTQPQIQSLPVHLIRVLNHDQIRTLTAQQRSWLGPQQKTALLQPNVVVPYTPDFPYPIRATAWQAASTTSFLMNPNLPDTYVHLYHRIHAHLFLHHDASNAYSNGHVNTIIPATIAALVPTTQFHWCRRRMRTHPNTPVSQVVKTTVEKEFDDAKKRALANSKAALEELIDNIGGIDIWQANHLGVAQAQTHRRSLLRRWYHSDRLVMSKLVLGNCMRKNINIDAIFSPANANQVNAQGVLIQQTFQQWLEESFVDTMIAASNGYILPPATNRIAAKTAATRAWTAAAAAFHAANPGLDVNDVPLV